MEKIFKATAVALILIFAVSCDFFFSEPAMPVIADGDYMHTDGSGNRHVIQITGKDSYNYYSDAEGSTIKLVRGGLRYSLGSDYRITFYHESGYPEKETFVLAFTDDGFSLSDGSGATYVFSNSIGTMDIPIGTWQDDSGCVLFITLDDGKPHFIYSRAWNDNTGGLMMFETVGSTVTFQDASGSLYGPYPLEIGEGSITVDGRVFAKSASIIFPSSYQWVADDGFKEKWTFLETGMLETTKNGITGTVEFTPVGRDTVMVDGTEFTISESGGLVSEDKMLYPYIPEFSTIPPEGAFYYSYSGENGYETSVSFSSGEIRIMRNGQEETRGFRLEEPYLLVSGDDVTKDFNRDQADGELSLVLDGTEAEFRKNPRKEDRMFCSDGFAAFAKTKAGRACGYVLAGFEDGMEKTELQIPSSLCGLPVVAIDDGAFANKGITSLSFEENEALEIGEEAFMSNMIESLGIPSFVTEIGKDAFRDNRISVIVNHGGIAIGGDIISGNPIYENPTDGIFSYGRKDDGTLELTGILQQDGGMLEIPASQDGTRITSIRDGLFRGTLYSGITIEEGGVEAIGAYTFADMPNLGKDSEVSVPENVEVHPLAFQNTEYDKYSNLMDGNLAYDRIVTDDGFAYVVTGSGNAGLEELVIPSLFKGKAVLGIAECAFKGMTGLDSVVFEDGLQVSKIGASAFECTGIKELDLPAGIMEIGDCAFSRSGLERITIAGKPFDPLGSDIVMEGDSFAFTAFERTCILKDAGPFSFTRNDDGRIGVSGSEGCDEACTALELPQVIFGGRLEVECINDGAFSNLADLKSLVIPSSYTRFGKGAFAGSSPENLTVHNKDLVIPEGFMPATVTYGDNYGDVIYVSSGYDDTTHQYGTCLAAAYTIWPDAYGTDGYLMIPESVNGMTVVGFYTGNEFEYPLNINKQGLGGLNIKSGAFHIPDDYFNGHNISKLILADGVTIGHRSFANNQNLEFINLTEEGTIVWLEKNREGLQTDSFEDSPVSEYL